MPTVLEDHLGHGGPEGHQVDMSIMQPEAREMAVQTLPWCEGVCCRNEHQFLPFHQVERWNSRYFHVGALWQVGLKLSLGHQGMACPSVARMEIDTEYEGKYSALYSCLPNRKVDATEGFGLSPLSAAPMESGFEGDMWGDPEIPITTDIDDDDVIGWAALLVT